MVDMDAILLAVSLEMNICVASDMVETIVYGYGMPGISNFDEKVAIEEFFKLLKFSLGFAGI